MGAAESKWEGGEEGEYGRLGACFLTCGGPWRVLSGDGPWGWVSGLCIPRADI